MKGVRRFRDRLKEDLKDPEFKKAFEEEEILASLAIQIAKIRQKKGISQKELAKRLNTTQQTVSRFEDIDNRSFTIRTLFRLSKALDTGLVIQFV